MDEQVTAPLVALIAGALVLLVAGGAVGVVLSRGNRDLDALLAEDADLSQAADQVQEDIHAGFNQFGPPPESHPFDVVAVYGQPPEVMPYPAPPQIRPVDGSGQVMAWPAQPTGPGRHRRPDATRWLRLNFQNGREPKRASDDTGELPRVR